MNLTVPLQCCITNECIGAWHVFSVTDEDVVQYIECQAVSALLEPKKTQLFTSSAVITKFTKFSSSLKFAEQFVTWCH